MCIERFSIECRNTKTKVPILHISLWSITKGFDNAVNQSKLETNTCSRHEARENVCERVRIGFNLVPRCLLTSLETSGQVRPVRHSDWLMNCVNICAQMIYTLSFTRVQSELSENTAGFQGSTKPLSSFERFLNEL